ncbi:M15 family metallopeptidase [Maridesulfovibrio salexigens]|uniref:Peptidase M15B and M15C DD-carboxypeptidase VanY/endolysin n=1 Tax=Maridesulfovibrio salexigens (strain ATCC 14822 / DSM 2638 / NCIMB 8403 / VKM B-1763) TaxID=526222 RepID=C6BTE7_MARSD|nr:M15 family metallopeptidase [Maridesulfovibrio salexigens]ACS81628.1 peptidase M15B and M15C DD-carboxypeptidase VanY/endolysin [Maridesulfovibrio salexigens DSM 2638]
MNRRAFLKSILSISAGAGLCGFSSFAGAQEITRPVEEKDLKDYLHRMANFDTPQPGDIILKDKDLKLLKSSLSRLRRVQRTVGFGNFCVLDFDDTLKFGRNYSSIGSFSKQEQEFLDKTFHFDAHNYGFFGEKPVEKLTTTISRKDLVKVPRTGNFLYRGDPYNKYLKIRKELGNNVYLTSGVRGVAKQFILFLAKAEANGGNLSLASRSLAPPGYSYHGVGDFDVGEKGLGAANFSALFAETGTCIKLREYGYLQLRYPENNLLGVRFEPWHIKV